MNLDGDTWSRSFSLDEPVLVLPIGGIEVAGRLRDAGDMVEFQFAYGGPPVGPEPVRLLVDLVAAPGVASAWSQTAVDVPPAAELRWTAVGPDRTEAPIVVADGTLGFRRSGLLELRWPPVWNSRGMDVSRLRARAVRGGYTEAVRVGGVYANAVLATHRQAQTQPVGDQLAGAPPLPGQQVTLSGTDGQLLDSPDEVTLRLTEMDGADHTWTSVAEWDRVGPDDRVFTVDRARGALVFGDGRAGRIPRIAPGAAAVAAYGIGGGPVGNAGAGSSWVRDGGDELADNPVPAAGGAEGESLDAASRRAAGDLARADRTVTVTDAEELALATPGVGLQRAHATLGLHPDFPCVPVSTALSVTVVPHAGRDGAPEQWTRAPRPDGGALAAAQAHLAAGRLIGQEVFVLPPAYRRVTVWVTVSRTARSDDLQTQITEALLRFLDPLRGGSDGNGWPFGGPVRPSALIGVVRRTLGPEAEVATLSAALDDEPATDCADLVIGPRELVWLADAPVSWSATAPAGAGLS